MRRRQKEKSLGGKAPSSRHLVLTKSPTKDGTSPKKDKELNELNDMGIKKNSQLSSSLVRLQKLGIVARFLEPPKEFMQ